MLSIREGDGTPLQYSCLESPMDGGAWWATVHGVTKSRTRLSDFPFTFHFHALEKEMATHSSVLAWKIPGMGEPGGLPSMGSHRVRHDWSDLAACFLYCDKLPSYPNFDFELFCTRIVTAATAHFCSQLRDILKVLVTQSCPTPSDPMDCSPPGSPIHGILQARVLEWVTIAFSV